MYGTYRTEQNCTVQYRLQKPVENASLSPVESGTVWRWREKRSWSCPARPSFCLVALIPTNRDPSSRGLLGDVRQVTCQIPWHPEGAPARTPGARKGSWTNGKGARSLSSSRGRIGVVPLILTTRGGADKYSGTVNCAARYLFFRGLTPVMAHDILFSTYHFCHPVSSIFFGFLFYRFLFRCSVHSHRGLLQARRWH